ncbi:MAG: hypothetical protein A3H97_21715 [Acidobacteria bacterium RIFCSPLOWO2_02_FULL_65_29]|nr:MAG: hypothetical protein A3H97_21715 [Acidobacteria bacterium RIFCSPLOWO2_02_FULL_65_29]
MTREPEKADFSGTELAQRINRIRRLMEERRLDALVVYDTGVPLTRRGGATVRYLTNFFNLAAGNPSAVVIPSTGEPVLCIGPHFSGCQFTWAGLLSPFAVKGHVTDELRPDWLRDFAEALSESGVRGGRVGIDGMRYMPAALLEGLRRKLEGTELVDVTGLVYESQIVRSKAEEPFIRKAAQISKLAMDAFLEAARPGVGQAEAVAIGEHTAYMAGAEDMVLFMGAGVPWLWGHKRTDLVFKEGDAVALEVNARYHGYFGQVCRTELLGKVSAEKQQMHDAARAAHDKMLSMVKPGITGQALFRAGVAEVRRRGFDYSGVRYGHGLGMTIAEGFDVAEEDTTPIPEGAYMVIHPMLIRSETGAASIHGDQFLVTANGPELLSKD